MKLYKISQKVNTDYDTYDSAVVAARTVTEAANITPDGYHTEIQKDDRTWVTSTLNVEVEYLGIADPGTKKGVIVSSFNAG